MKSIRYILSICSFIFLLVGCSDDDGEVVSNDEMTIASGIYNLVELNIDPAQDINEDGNTTSNVLSELQCAIGTLNLKADATWSWSFLAVNVTSITGGVFRFNCAPETTVLAGSWKVQNGQISLFDGANSFTFTINEDMITYTVNDDLPGFKSIVYER